MKMNKAIAAAQREATLLGFNYAFSESQHWVDEMKTIVRAMVMLEIADNETACDIVESAFWAEYDRACEIAFHVGFIPENN